MRISELLNEGIRPALLYHGTNGDAAEKILYSNVIRNNTDHSVYLPGDRTYPGVKNKELNKYQRLQGVSLSRNPRFVRRWTSGAGVVLAFDYASIRRNCRIVPFNYYDSKEPVHDESEEFLIGKLEPVDKYLVGIYMSAATYEDLKEQNENFGGGLYDLILNHPLLQIQGKTWHPMNGKLIHESIEQLDELTLPDTMRDAHYKLEQAGYDRIGEGIFAWIYSKPGADHVLKLFRSTDRAYMDFVKVVTVNPNIHFPKFKGKMMKVNDNYYAIRMEKLSETIDHGTAHILKAYINKGKYPKTYNGPKASTTYAISQMNDLEKEQPGITTACDIIAKTLAPKYVVDLHTENIMMRGNTLVIIDPVC